MGSAYKFPPGTGILPSLPVADLSTGAVGIVTTMLALRDRAVRGGSYHGTAALTAYQAVSLLPEVGLYQREVVGRLQERFRWGEMTPDLHVEELLEVVRDGWVRTTGFERREEFFVTFPRSAFGRDLRIVAPVVRYGDQGMTPKWGSPPKPYRSDGEVRFAGEG